MWLIMKNLYPAFKKIFAWTVQLYALNQKSVLTGEVFQALAGVASFPTATLAVVLTRAGVAQVDLRLAVVPGEADRTAAAQPVDGVDGSEQNRVGGDEGRGTVELQHRHTLHVVLTGLPQADVVVKRQNLERRFKFRNWGPEDQKYH